MTKDGFRTWQEQKKEAKAKYIQEKCEEVRVWRKQTVNSWCADCPRYQQCEARMIGMPKPRK